MKKVIEKIKMYDDLLSYIEGHSTEIVFKKVLEALDLERELTAEDW